jgi:hypothetical protein
MGAPTRLVSRKGAKHAKGIRTFCRELAAATNLAGTSRFSTFKAGPDDLATLSTKQFYT